MMLKEFVESLQKSAIDGAKPVVIENETLFGPGRFGVACNGALNVHDVPPTRQHEPADLETLVALAMEFDGEFWVGEQGVHYLIDRASRREKATMSLTKTEPFCWLEAAASKASPINQAALILLLRTTFRHWLSSAGEIITILRNLDFKLADNSSGNIEHGKSSVGRQLRAEVSGRAALPEYLTLVGPVFHEAPTHHQRVEVAIEPDPATQSFRLIPIAGDVDSAVQKCLADIQGRIKVLLGKRAEMVPIYRGVP